jgi:hypothetical protein
MKKVFLLLLLSVASLVSFAQSISLGIKGSANLANIVNKYNYATVSSSTGTITTFSIGAFVDLRLRNWSVQPGAYFTGKGGKESQSISATDLVGGYSVKLNPFYVQVPVPVLYHIPVVAGEIFLGAGPYAAFAVSGKITGSSTYAQEGDPGFESHTTNIDRNLKFGNAEGNDLKSRDYGATFLAGFKLTNGILLSANYDLGTSDIGVNGSGVKRHNHVLGFSVGIVF